MLFLQHLLADVSRRCSTSTHRDLEEIAARVKTEGFSFLAITLPAYCKDLQRALANGQVDPSLFAGFGKRGQLPTLLGGLLDLVFDRWSGRLLDEPSIAAIQAIRQVTLAFGKIERKCSDERIQAAYQAYVECEQELRASDRARSPIHYLDFERVAALLWRSLNSSLDRKIFDGELIPSHGPGQTADRLVGNQKFTLNEWTTRMEDAGLHYVDYATSSKLDYASRMDRVVFLEPGAERPARLTDVPKTLGTPRIIAMEPTCMMFMQQALLAEMKEEFRTDEFARNLICFDSQEPNQLLAREGSLTGALATLDLKEASDRVSNQIVLSLFARWPHLSEYVQAVRSRTVEVPGFGKLRLAKYASMGSGLTFPLEAMVFCTLVFLGIESDLKRPLSQKDIKSYFGKVRVYGDDIVVPVEHVGSVIKTLEAFGAKVNTQKSFWTGRFRESCGEEYYAGIPVGVARVRSDFPQSRRDGEQVVSMVSLRNQLFELGYEKTVEFLDEELFRLLGKARFPLVGRNSPALGRWTHGNLFETHKVHEHEQRPLVKAYVQVPRIPKNEIDGYAALHKVLLRRSQTPFEDEQHLTFSGRATVTDIELKWTSPV